MKEKRLAGAALYHIIIFAIGIIMVYPLIWMVMSSFKETNTIFTTASSLIPEHFVTDNYANGWKGFAKISFSTFFKNSIFISVIATIGTIASSAVVAYGFARFKFRGKGILFSAMLLSMMLPAQVLMIPQYLWYQKLGWVGSFLPLTVPYFFAIQGFFVYLLSNFIGGIPIELDEAAKIDGANAVQTFFKITLPYMLFVMTPYLITQFTGNINNFNVIFLLSGGNPTPVDATAGKTDLLVTWLYKLTVDKNYYNLGAVIGIMTFIVLAIVALVTYRNTASYKDEEGFM